MNIATPREGMAVTFEEIHVGGKGPRAVAAQPANEAVVPRNDNARQRTSQNIGQSGRSRGNHSESAPGSGALFALPLMLAYGAAIVWAVWARHLPWWVLPALLFLNAATFFAYMQDKYAASQGAWRTGEGTLHVWSLVGGWPGAWFAQQLLRHKSRKKEFREVYWATVVLHCAAVGGWFFYLR